MYSYRLTERTNSQNPLPLPKLVLLNVGIFVSVHSVYLKAHAMDDGNIPLSMYIEDHHRTRSTVSHVEV